MQSIPIKGNLFFTCLTCGQHKHADGILSTQLIGCHCVIENPLTLEIISITYHAYLSAAWPGIMDIIDRKTPTYQQIAKVT
jgi:hypothetical protein